MISICWDDYKKRKLEAKNFLWEREIEEKWENDYGNDGYLELVEAKLNWERNFGEKEGINSHKLSIIREKLFREDRY